LAGVPAAVPGSADHHLAGRTPVVIVLVVLLNATIGFVQESRAEATLDALKRMLVTTAAVRRDGGGEVSRDGGRRGAPLHPDVAEHVLTR
jgi:magnesium-transporting ATPase (P-type)